MNFINNNIDLLNIIQILIDKGAVLYGKTLRRFLIDHKLEKLSIFLPSNDTIQEVAGFRKYFEYSIELNKEQFAFHVFQRENKFTWKINDLTLNFTIVKPKYKHDIDNLALSTNGITTLCGKTQQKSIRTLKLLREINNKPEYDTTSINVMLEWIRYFISQDNYIYGSWPSKFITSTREKDMERDIDIVADDMVSMYALMRVLDKTGLCKNSNIKDDYDVPALNVTINCDTYLNLDIHKKSNNMTCDAWYNNMKMTNEFITVNYQVNDLNYISCMILLFNDIFHHKYTLICPIPSKISATRSDFRLLAKPVVFLSERSVDYSYLEYGNKTFVTLEEISSKDCCCRKQHKVNDELKFPPVVFNLAKKNICLHCLHKHVLANKINKGIKELFI